jgi:hypothetical protein
MQSEQVPLSSSETPYDHTHLDDSTYSDLVAIVTRISVTTPLRHSWSYSPEAPPISQASSF